MKKILLFFCCLPMVMFAQIAPVQTYDKPYEFIAHIIYLDKKTNTYYLHLQSDNEFEDRVIRYKIGNTGREAATSIANLYATLGNADQLFDVGPYQFVVRYDVYIQLVKRGDMYYTAGNYRISKYNMINAIKRLIIDHDAACGDVTLIADDLQYGKLYMECKYYGITFNLEIGKNLLPLLSKTYEIGDHISTEDAMSLRQAAIDGRINCQLLTTLCKQ